MAMHRIPDGEGPRKPKVIYTPKSNSRRNWALSIAGIIGTGALIVGLSQDGENDTSVSSPIKNGQLRNSGAVPGGGSIQIPSQNGSSLTPKNPSEGNEEPTEVSWKSDSYVVAMVNQLLSRKDKAVFLSNVSKMPKEKQLLLLNAIKEFGLLSDAVENLRFFNAVSKADLEDFLFHGLIPSTNQFRDIIVAMKASNMYTEREIIELFFEKGYKDSIFASLDTLTKNPFEYLKNLFGTKDQKDLGAYYHRYKTLLTPEQLGQLKEMIRAEQIPIPGDLRMSEDERRQSAQVRISEGNFASIDKFIKPEDTINKGDLLAKMLSENDYLSILENSVFLGLQPYQILEYSRNALRMQMASRHGWGRFSELIGRGVIPDEILGDVIRALEGINVKFSVIIGEPRLLNLYGRQRAFQELFATKSYSVLAQDIFILRPTKDQADQLARAIINDESEFARGLTGFVFKYIDSLK